MEKIIENATIIYKNGLKKICEAISITLNGVYVGRIEIKDDDDQVFINHSYIPNDQIQKIMFFNEDGKQKDIDFKKPREGGKK